MRVTMLIALLVMLYASATAAEIPDSIPEEYEVMNHRPVTGYYNIEIGAFRSQATYLSPLHYHGVGFGLSGLWTKASSWQPRKMTMEFEGGADFSRMLNPAGTASMMNVMMYFRFGLAWRKALPHRLQLTAGGYYGLQGGALWLFRNSNNPVEARAWTGIGGRLTLSWATRLGRVPIVVSDRIAIPLAGIFFQQQYGESYYEIYLGNHKGLAHFGYPGNFQGIDNLLGITFNFGRTAMQVGYRFRMENQEACHLVTREFKHMLVLGVVPGGL
ncbi:MAG: DUF3316 domain-containing protein [Clostridium sp.]|nr:DUF3316 domain-containing protein [Prevotella sp.]MCM1429493.1 DUF3316 domain-containing protein [Clostridium sp.]